MSFEPLTPKGMSLREDGFQLRPAWRRGVVSSVIMALSCRSSLAYSNKWSAQRAWEIVDLVGMGTGDSTTYPRSRPAQVPTISFHKATLTTLNMNGPSTPP
eukprot:4702580-Pyramimonas_sp.AAC.1